MSELITFMWMPAISSTGWIKLVLTAVVLSHCIIHNVLDVYEKNMYGNVFTKLYLHGHKYILSFFGFTSYAES